jgi:hypothetical protein
MLVEKVLKICWWTWCWKTHKAKKIFFYASLFENKLNIFQFGIVKMITSKITTYEIEGCLAKIMVSNGVTLMNCHH